MRRTGAPPGPATIGVDAPAPGGRSLGGPARPLMAFVFPYALLLLVAVFASRLAHRSILSTAVLFLVGGFLAGDGVAGLITVDPGGPVVRTFSLLALFSVLFTDGMRIGARELRMAWRLPGRALVFGMPLTLVLTAVLAHFLAGIGWLEAFLVGAALSPTDPVFAAAIVGREEIPGRLRRLLNVESGLNDGLALPVVILLLKVIGQQHTDGWLLVAEVLGGIAIGVVVPAAVAGLSHRRSLVPTEKYQPLTAFAVGLLVLSSTVLLGANEFLAAFAAGVTLATVGEDIAEAFERFGDLVTELLKLAALFIFGALISPELLGSIPIGGAFLALGAIVLARPVAIAVSLAGSDLSRKERAAAAWFGPKGFASVVYGLLIAEAGFAGSLLLFHLVALVVVVSIIAHSSTDVVIARWFRE